MNEMTLQTETEVSVSKFYHYNQNNSGGSFVLDEQRGLTHHVIIEAYSADEADVRAEEIGIYFGGLGDCPCCGDRWSEQYGDEGNTVPTIYGEPIETYISSHNWMPPGKESVVHYLDGRVVWHGAFKKVS